MNPKGFTRNITRLTTICQINSRSWFIKPLHEGCLSRRHKTAKLRTKVTTVQDVAFFSVLKKGSQSKNNENCLTTKRRRQELSEEEPSTRLLTSLSPRKTVNYAHQDARTKTAIIVHVITIRPTEPEKNCPFARRQIGIYCSIVAVVFPFILSTSHEE